jgi:hypothetical protein
MRGSLHLRERPEFPAAPKSAWPFLLDRDLTEIGKRMSRNVKSIVDIQLKWSVLHSWSLAMENMLHRPSAKVLSLVVLAALYASGLIIPFIVAAVLAVMVRHAKG